MREHRLSTRAATRRAGDVFRQVREAADRALGDGHVAALCGDIDAEVERVCRLLERSA
jgi:hypothetical protein